VKRFTFYDFSAGSDRSPDAGFRSAGTESKDVQSVNRLGVWIAIAE
jgi:hypothetical protein